MKAQESDAQERTDLQITVCENGVINCRNPAYERGHTYSVMLDDDGSAVRCTCKGHRYHGHCYHADEVESRPLIVSSAESLAASYSVSESPTPYSSAERNKPRSCSDERVSASCGDEVDEPLSSTEDNSVATDGGEVKDDSCENGVRGCSGTCHNTDDMCDDCTEESYVFGGPGQ